MGNTSVSMSQLTSDVDHQVVVDYDCCVRLDQADSDGVELWAWMCRSDGKGEVRVAL